MEQRYYEFAFKNGENFHIKEKDVDKLVNESGCKILTWEDYKPFAIKGFSLIIIYQT